MTEDITRPYREYPYHALSSLSDFHQDRADHYNPHLNIAADWHLGQKALIEAEKGHRE